MLWNNIGNQHPPLAAQNTTNRAARWKMDGIPNSLGTGVFTRDITPATRKTLTVSIQWSAIISGLALLAVLAWRASTGIASQANTDADQTAKIERNVVDIQEGEDRHREDLRAIQKDIKELDIRQQDRHNEILERQQDRHNEILERLPRR